MDPTKDIVEGSACIYERSSAIKYALGNQTRSSAPSATTPVWCRFSFSSCICRTSTRDGGSHFKPMIRYCWGMRNMRIPIGTRRKGNERIGRPEFIPRLLERISYIGNVLIQALGAIQWRSRYNLLPGHGLYSRAAEGEGCKYEYMTASKN